MRDYKLSEIKKICEKWEYCNSGCPFYIDDEVMCSFLYELSKTPILWKIDKKDGDEE